MDNCEFKVIAESMLNYLVEHTPVELNVLIDGTRNTINSMTGELTKEIDRSLINDVMLELIESKLIVKYKSLYGIVDMDAINNWKTVQDIINRNRNGK